MGWFDQDYGDWFSGDYGGGTDYSGDSFDWSSVWGDGDAFNTGDGGSNYDFSDLGSGGDSSSGSGFNWSSLFGGSGSSGSGNIFGALLSGLSGAAGSWMDSKNAEKAMKMKGEQDRKSLAFAADLQDYQQQLDKQRKRVALDTYGQFSQIKRYAPKYQNTPAVQVPTKPNAGSY